MISGRVNDTFNNFTQSSQFGVSVHDNYTTRITDGQFDKKSPPRYPQAVSLEKSTTLELSESVSRPYAGISQ